MELSTSPSSGMACGCHFRASASIQDFETVKAHEVRIVLDGSPSLIRMLVEHGETYFLDRPAIFGSRARVIDHPVGRAFRRNLRLTQKDHDVVGHLLYPGLIEEEQVARLGSPPVATDEDRVEILERARVRKLRE